MVGRDCSSFLQNIRLRISCQKKEKASVLGIIANVVGMNVNSMIF
jgi:hypothetical protein